MGPTLKVDTFDDHTLVTYYGLTQAQVARLPNYVVDCLNGALRDLKEANRKLATAEGVLPQDDSWGQEGMVVDTYAGDYVFPFKQYRAGGTLGPKRGDVSLHFPGSNGRMQRVEMSWRSERPNEVEISGGLRGIAIKPRASNTFTLVVDND